MAPEDIALIALDVDGTLIEHPEKKVIWELLNQRFVGDEKVNVSRYQDYREGRIDYPTWVSLDVGGWMSAGATQEQVLEVVRSLRPVLGVRESLQQLKDAGYRLAVISGTLDVVLNEFFNDGLFAEIYTNRLRFDGTGRLVGWEATPFDMDGKARALEHLARLYDLPLHRCAFVGDNMNDLGVARIAGFTVAFNPKVKELEDLAHAVVVSDRFEPVRDLFLR